MVVDELPKNIALVLPQAGGKYLFSTTQLGNKLSIISNLSLTRSVYNPEEYHYLKELYARIIQIQQSQIVFRGNDLCLSVQVVREILLSQKFIHQYIKSPDSLLTLTILRN